MAKDTKERILETALEMFSQNGYNGTNIRELTAALGLVKSSIYKHFEDKEAMGSLFTRKEKANPIPSRISHKANF